MRFPENFIQEVVDRTDIEALIGRYVTLKRTGSNLLGLCPFHSEKTPSFTVSLQPGASVTMMGLPIAIASCTVLGMPSL